MKGQFLPIDICFPANNIVLEAKRGFSKIADHTRYDQISALPFRNALRFGQSFLCNTGKTGMENLSSDHPCDGDRS